MPDPQLFAATRVRDLATDDVKSASEWQRIVAERDGVGPFGAWAAIAAAIVARTMRIEGEDTAR